MEINSSSYFGAHCWYLGMRVTICVRERNEICAILLCSRGLIPVQTSRSLPFRGEKARQQWEGDEEDSVPLHSYQFSALIRLDWRTGMSQVGTV